MRSKTGYGFVVALVAGLGVVGNAAVAPGATKKPPAKAPATKGTGQMPGDVGTVGTTYTLSDGTHIQNLTIRKLRYVASRMTLNGKTVYPEADKKFLVVDYTLQNPNSGSEVFAYHRSFKLTGVDAQNQNYELQDDAEDTTTHKELNISLKPGQRVEGREYLIVPAATEIPKLILAWDGPKVMRFDLHGVVAPVEPLLADPADKTGATALATIPAAKGGVAYPCGPLDLTVIKFGFSDNQPGIRDLPDGKRYLVCTLRAKSALNEADGDASISYGNNFKASVLTEDGDKIDSDGNYYKGSANEETDTNVAPGVEKTFRILFPVPKTGGLKTVTISPSSNVRKLVYDVSGVQ